MELCNVALGAGRRGFGEIPAGAGRGRARGGLGVARDRFGSASGVEMADGEACGGGSRGQPRYARLRRGCGWGQRVGRLGILCRC
jgi:hypothetical protein